MDQIVFKNFLRSITTTIMEDEADELFELIDHDDSGYITL